MSQDNDHHYDDDDDDYMDEQSSSSQSILAAGVFIGVITIRAIRRCRARQFNTLVHDDIRSIPISDLTVSHTNTPLLKSPHVSREHSVFCSPFENTSMCSEDTISESDILADGEKDVNVFEQAGNIVYQRRIMDMESDVENEKSIVQRNLCDQLSRNTISEKKMHARNFINSSSLLEKVFTYRKSQGLVDVCML